MKSPRKPISQFIVSILWIIIFIILIRVYSVYSENRKIGIGTNLVKAAVIETKGLLKDVSSTWSEND